MKKLYRLNRLITRCILMVSLSALISCGGSGLSEQETLQKARNYLEQGELQAASIELRNLLQANSENAEARYLLGEINMDIGDYQGAEKDFKRSASAGWKQEQAEIGIVRAQMSQYQFRKVLDEIEINETWPASARADLLGLRAAAEASLGDMKKANASLAKGVKLAPDALYILKATAIFQLDKKETDDAAATLDRALSTYPDNTELLLIKATTELLQNKTTDAADTYRKIIAQDKPILVTAHGRLARIGLARLQVLSKNFEQAKSTLAPLYKRNEKDPEANFLGGVVAFEQKDYAVAEEHARKLLEMAPNNHPSQQLMGRIKYAQKDYDQAEHYLSAYLSAVPDDLATRKLLANTYLAQRHPDMARTTLQPALQSNPDDPGLLFLMSQLELSGGNTQASIVALRKAVDASPDNPELHKQLANAYIVAGNSAAAIRELQIFKEKSKKTEEANNLIIVAHLRAGQFEQAINLAKDMLKSKPEDPGTTSVIGSLYAASGDMVQARLYFEKTLSIESNFPAAVTGLARIEGMKGNIEKATELYKSLVDSGKGGTSPMMALAELAEKQGRTQAMLDWLEKARNSAPNEIKPRVLLATYYLQHNQPDKADILVQEAIRISPADPVVLALQGKMLIAQKRYSEAVTPLSKLVSLQPDSADSRAQLGETYMRLGMTGNAREHLGKALESDGKHALSLGLMAEMELQAGQADKSLTYARRLQQVQPALYYGYMQEGDALMALQDYSNARKAYGKAWERQRTAKLAIKLYATEKRSGNIEGATQALQSWLADHPDDTSTRLFLASAYQGTGLNKLAIPEYEKVLENAPDNGTALNNLAWLYSITGNPKALQLAERAYRATPDNPAVQDTYGWVLVQQGQPDKGRRLLKQALEKLPDTLEVRYHYAAALLKSGEAEEGRKLLKKLLDEGKDFNSRKEAQQLLAEDNITK